MIKSPNTRLNWKSLLTPLVLVLLGVSFSYYVVEYPKDSIVERFISYDKILKLLGQHILLVVVSGAAAIVTSVPLGILLTRPAFKRFSNLVVNLVNIGQTVPSLAVLALFVGILGVGVKPAIFALWLYSLLPILNNTLAGILGVDKSILEAAKGMGMRPRRVLVKIELPLASSIIMAGIRTAITINIGTATLAGFIGAGGLGDFIIAGNNINRWQIYILGAVLSALLAILVDYLLGALQIRLGYNYN